MYYKLPFTKDPKIEALDVVQKKIKENDDPSKKSKYQDILDLLSLLSLRKWFLKIGKNKIKD